MTVSVNNGQIAGMTARDGGPVNNAGGKASAPANVTETVVPSGAHLAELQRVWASLSSSAPTPGVTDCNGAPEIGGVRLEPEDMAAALLVLQGKTQEAQIRTSSEGIQTNKVRLESRNNEALGKIQKANAEGASMLAKEKAAGIFGWVVKVAALIGAVVGVAMAALAEAATGGAASPLLALAISGLVGACISMASQISQTAGGPALDLSVVVPKLFTIVLEACGVPEEQAQAAGKVIAGATALAMPLALVSDPQLLSGSMGGIAQLAGGSAEQVAIVSAVFTVMVAIAGMVALTGTGVSSARMLSDLPKVVTSASQIAQTGMGVLTGAAGATQGGLSAATSVQQRNVDQLQVDRKTIDADIIRLMAKMKDDQEELKKALEMIADSYTVVSQMIQAAAENRLHIASNLARPVAV